APSARRSRRRRSAPSAAPRGRGAVRPVGSRPASTSRAGAGRARRRRRIHAARPEYLSLADSDVSAMLSPLALVHPECRRCRNLSAPEREPMNLKPPAARLIVEPLEEGQTTVAGIVLPDTAVEKPQRGNVVAVGPGERSRETGEVIPMDVNEGDIVVFSKYGGTEIKIEGTDYLILRESDVLAKVVGDRELAGAKA